MKLEQEVVADQSEEDSAAEVVDETTDKTETENEAESAEGTDGTDDANNADESDDQETQEPNSGKLFNEEQQAIFNKRVGKEVEKRKALEKKVQELEGSLNESKSKSDPDVLKASESIGIPAAYLNTSESKLLAEYDKWVEVRNFCRTHKDGFIGKGGNEKDMSTDDIQAWAERASDNLLEIAPEAKALKRSKAKQLAEDAALGRKIRTERESAANKKKIETNKTAVAGKLPSVMAPAPANKNSRITNESYEKGKLKPSDFFKTMVGGD